MYLCLMSASVEMPYFIKPSIVLSNDEKIQAYEAVKSALKANLYDATDITMKMVTINCLLKTYLPYFYWVGFYLVRNNRLEVGPYQGTLGCLYIDFDRGVCGKAASTGKTQIVQDCHILQEGTQHIACDPNSKSEIVVPVFGENNKMIAVLDVDSTLKGSFDHIDQNFLESIVSEHFRNNSK